jgi:hypothetical protein
MLEDSGVVRQRADMSEVDLGPSGRATGKRLRLERAAAAARLVRQGAREGFDILPRNRGPRHFPAVLGRTSTHRPVANRVATQLDDFARDGARILPWHKRPPPVGQQLARVDVRCGDDRFACAHGIGERA